MATEIKTNKTPLLFFAVLFFYFVAPLESMAIVSQFSLPKLLAIVVIVARLLSFKPIKKTKSLSTFLPLLLYAILSIIWSIDAGNSAQSVLLFLIPSILVMESIDTSINSKKEITYYLGAFCLGTLYTVIVGLINRNQIIADAEIVGQERLSAFGQDKNTYAFFINMAVVILLFFYRKATNKILKLLFLVALVSSAFAIASTGSRTGLFVLAMILLLFVLSSGKLSSSGLVLIVFIFGFIILIPFIPTEIIERYTQSGDLISKGDFSERGIIWERAWEAFKNENIMLGVGYSNFSEMLGQHYDGWRFASHNTYLTYLIEFGFVGVFTFIYALTTIIKSTIKIFKTEKNIFIFSFIIPLFITMFFLETEYKRWIFMFAVLLFNYEKLVTTENKLQ